MLEDEPPIVLFCVETDPAYLFMQLDRYHWETKILEVKHVICMKSTALNPNLYVQILNYRHNIVDSDAHLVAANIIPAVSVDDRISAQFNSRRITGSSALQGFLG